jgi:hypothetical protein
MKALLCVQLQTPVSIQYYQIGFLLKCTVHCCLDKHVTNYITPRIRRYPVIPHSLYRVQLNVGPAHYAFLKQTDDTTFSEVLGTMVTRRADDIPCCITISDGPRSAPGSFASNNRTQLCSYTELNWLIVEELYLLKKVKFYLYIPSRHIRRVEV